MAKWGMMRKAPLVFVFLIAGLTAATKVGIALRETLEADKEESLRIRIKPVRSRQNRNITYRLSTILRAVSTTDPTVGAASR